MFQNMISGHVKGIFLTVKLGAEIYTNDMRLHNKLEGYLCFFSAEMKQ